MRREEKERGCERVGRVDGGGEKNVGGEAKGRERLGDGREKQAGDVKRWEKRGRGTSATQDKEGAAGRGRGGKKRSWEM